MADQNPKLTPIRAQIDEHGNIFAAEEDLEQALSEAEKKAGKTLSRGALDHTKPVQVAGISFRFIGSNKEWQE